MKYFRINQFEKTKKFLSSIDKYSLVYHKDSDGVCSAVLLSKILKNPDFQSPNDLPSIEISKELFKKVNQYPKAVFVDLAIDQLNFQDIKTKTLVVDHHVTKNNLNQVTDNFVHVNPRLKDPDIYIPASYLVYKILEKMKKNVKKYSWIASVGIVGDRGTKNCKDIIELTQKQNKMDIKELDFISNLIEASKGVKGIMGISEAYNIFYESESPVDIVNSKLIRYYHKYQKEINNLMTDFDYHSEYFPETNSYLYEIQSRYNVSGVLSTKISEKNPDAAFFIYKTRNYLFVSARCQTSRINVGKILKELSEGMGKGGGHPQAAGASVPKKYSEEFLERLRSYLSGA